MPPNWDSKKLVRNFIFHVSWLDFCWIVQFSQWADKNTPGLGDINNTLMHFLLWQVPADDADLEKHHDHGGGVFNQQIWGGPNEEGGDAPREAAQSVQQPVHRQLLRQRLVLQPGLRHSGYALIRHMATYQEFIAFFRLVLVPVLKFRHCIWTLISLAVGPLSDMKHLALCHQTAELWSLIYGQS